MTTKVIVNIFIVIKQKGSEDCLPRALKNNILLCSPATPYYASVWINVVPEELWDFLGIAKRGFSWDPGLHGRGKNRPANPRAVQDFLRRAADPVQQSLRLIRIWVLASRDQ